MKNKLNEWVKRYLPAELFSLALTLLSSELTFFYTQNQIATALTATFIGNIAYFGCILLNDVRLFQKQCLSQKQPYTYLCLLKNIRALLIEFGFAEVIDSFLIRPALMYYLPIAVNNLTWGTVLAKISADITFYIPAIIFYELSKKRYRSIH
jgi:hypothetical protein